MKRVLFVCLGNICRSPTAEAVFNKLVSERGLGDRYACESAGTASYHVGERPDPRSLEAGENHGLKFKTRAQVFESSHFDEFDLIVTMDSSNLARVRNLAASQADSTRALPMVQFLKKMSAEEIPDPYYGGPDGFDHVIDLLEDACEGLIHHLESKRNQST